MKNDWIYVRAVRVLISRDFMKYGKLQEIKSWADNVAEVVDEMNKHTGIKVGMHIEGDYVFVMCRNDTENEIVCDFLRDRLPNVDICKPFPSIEKKTYEGIWGPYIRH